MLLQSVGFSNGNGSHGDAVGYGIRMKSNGITYA
jgi:hypothetical protein